MNFSVTELKQFKVNQKEEEGSPESLIWDYPDFAKFVGKVKLSAEARLISENVLVTGQVSANLRFNCVKCLNEFEYYHQARFQQIYSFEGEIIDISNEVRESFLIDLPMHPVCNPNCKGVLPNQANQHNPSVLYSDELKSDPRWDALKKINKNKEK